MTYEPSTDAERALELDLRNTIRRNAWRLKAGLPLRPDPQAVRAWQATCYRAFFACGYRRRHPITTPPTAA